MKAIVVDYGAGNLYSISHALQASGAEVVLEPDPQRALRGDVLVLPGVGAFSTATERIFTAREEIVAALRAGHPCLAICLGMQLLFERSEEGHGEGLGVVPGDVRRLTTEKVPHMGWNALEDVREPLVTAAALHSAYFANSFVCHPMSKDTVLAWTMHESQRLPAVIRFANTIGVQFHPEKSAQPGRRFIAGFLREVAA